jgi:hypothetical protein
VLWLDSNIRRKISSMCRRIQAMCARVAGEELDGWWSEEAAFHGPWHGMPRVGCLYLAAGGTDTGRCVSGHGYWGGGVGRAGGRGVPVDRPLLADIPFSSPQPTDRIGSMESDAFSSFHPAAPRPQLARSCFSPFHTPRIKRLAGLYSVLTLIDRL